MHRLLMRAELQEHRTDLPQVVIHDRLAASNPNGSISSRILTPGRFASSFNNRWIWSLNRSSFDDRSGTLNTGGTSARTVFRDNPLPAGSPRVRDPRSIDTSLG